MVMSAGLCYGKQLAEGPLTAQSYAARAPNVNLDTNNHKRREDEQSTQDSTAWIPHQTYRHLEYESLQNGHRASWSCLFESQTQRADHDKSPFLASNGIFMDEI